MPPPSVLFVLCVLILRRLCVLQSGLCYAELASMFPVAGSAYAYAYASIGEFWACMIGWVSPAVKVKPSTRV
jgi:APA family basic amino acid/polyamine antiporter